MDQIASLILEIDAYLARTEMSPTDFGEKAVNNGKIVSRLRAGKNTTIKTIQRLRQFMIDNPPTPKRARAA